MNRSIVSGTKPCAWIKPVENLYKKGTQFRWQVYSITIIMTYDAYMLPKINTVRRLMMATQTLDIVNRWHCNKESIWKKAFAVWCTLMWWWKILSHILFNNPKCIMTITCLPVITNLVPFMILLWAGIFYIFVVNSCHIRQRTTITGLASTQAKCWITGNLSVPIGGLFA